MQLEIQKEQMKAQVENQSKALEEQRIAKEQEQQFQLDMEKIASDLQIQKYKVDKEIELKRELAMMEFVVRSNEEKETAEKESADAEIESQKSAESKEHMNAILTSIAALQTQLIAPKKRHFHGMQMAISNQQL
jgi:hypothetical protein